MLAVASWYPLHLQLTIIKTKVKCCPEWLFGAALFFASSFPKKGKDSAKVSFISGNISIFAPVNGKNKMEVIFNEEYLQEMYETGRTDKQHRFQPQIIRKYIRVIDLMKEAANVLELSKYNSLNYEKLEGDKAGLSSVRVNIKYRIEFEEYVKDGETVTTICNITELSNHYK